MPGCTETRALLKQMCDYIVAEKATMPTIYVGGYYMRTLVGGYEILGDQRYLDTALAYSDYLLGKQMSNGFWPTGYGSIYLADTGSALGLFIALYKHAGPERQKKFLDAVLRYANSIAEERHDSSQWGFRDRLGACRGRHDDEAYSRPVHAVLSPDGRGDFHLDLSHDRQERVP